ncbi:alanine racemase [Acidobacteria bacterium AH-259-D05]|nr:alanine racemase [Acidobacteria bacterium AH-259-D05]
MKGSWVEVSLSRLQENSAAVRNRLSSSTRIIAVVKANAYGHGVEQVSKCLFNCGILDFSVATLEEAVELRQSIPKGKILVLQGCLAGEEKAFREYDLTASLFDLRRVPEDIKVEVKLDTGMTRLGIPWEEAGKMVRELDAKITGLYSHFACSDQDPDFTRLQLKRFEQATADLAYPRHISNSAGLQFPEAHLDAVRLGLLLYGISPSPSLDWVQPILSWKTRILTLRSIPKGQSIGYGRTFTTSRDSLIGVLPVGYADGYNRLFSNQGQVRIQGQLVPLVGQVNMDLISVDLTDVSNPAVGEEVVLLEDSSDSPISVTAWAETLETIPYEVFTSIKDRVERVYLDG